VRFSKLPPRRSGLTILFSALAAALPAHAVTVTSPTHPVAVFHDFSASPVPFTAYAVPGGVPSGARFEIVNGALQITNAHAGSFGIDTKTKAFNAETFGHLYFDYKLSPQVKVNVFFRIKGKYHGAILSGPKQVRPGSALLGTIEGVQADGAWHQAHIPLRDWLRKLYPADDILMVDEIIIGNWDNSGWLMAGMGGNGPGAQWSIDNFAIIGAGPQAAKFDLTENGNPLANPSRFAWSVGEKPTTIPRSSFEATANGFSTLRITDGKGQVVATTVLLATAPPRIGDMALRDNTITTAIEAPAGLDNRELKLTVGDRSFDRTSPFLLWDGERNLLSLDAARAGLVWPNGTKVDVEISGAKDLLARPVAARKVTLTVDYARHAAAPPVPIVPAITAEMGTGTFETGKDEWFGRDDRGAIVEFDSSNPAGGQAALRLTSPSNAAMFGVWIRRTPFDAVKFPIITFEYRIPPDLRSDFTLVMEGKPYSIKFTDTDNPQFRLGAIEGIVADNKWHRAEIDLLSMLRKLRPDAPSYRIDTLALADEKWLGNARGLQNWIDNFQFVPQLSGQPFKAEVQIKDVTGLKAISWVIDEAPGTEPPATGTGTAIEYTGTGRKWLHVRAQNGAGKWGPPAHFPILLSTP